MAAVGAKTGLIVILVGILLTGAGVAGYAAMSGENPKEIALLDASVPVAPAELARSPALDGRAVRAQGSARAESPSPSPVDGAPCVYREETVVRENVKQRPRYRSREDYARRRARFRNEQIWREEWAAPTFRLEGGGASVAVSGKATWELAETPKVPPTASTENALFFGKLEIPKPEGAAAGNVFLRRHLVRQGVRVTAIGIARAGPDGVAIVPDASGTLIVTDLSDADLRARLETRETVARVAFLGFGGLGVLVIGIGAVLLVRR